MNLFAYFLIPAIVRGFVGILVAGTLFPVTGIFVLRFNLITFRFTIMHAVILAGAFALALHIDLLAASLVVCIIITLFLSPLARAAGIDTGLVSAFLMIVTMAAAVTVMYKAGVSAKDTLEILWGNIYAITNREILITVCFALIPCGFTLLYYRQLSCLLFDRDIAYTTGVNEKALLLTVMVITGMTITFIMRLIGALLLDAILLLPALAAMRIARSLKGFFLASMLIGFLSSAAGFIFSLLFDIPASAGVSLAAGSFFIVSMLIKKINTRSRALLTARS